MRIPSILSLLALALTTLAAPVPAPQGYGDYGSYPAPEGGYGSYSGVGASEGAAAPPAAPQGGYGGYGSYGGAGASEGAAVAPAAPEGGYGSYPAPEGGYGAYKRDVEDVVKV